MTQSAKHWTILGAGAIGHLLACRFAQQKIPAVLLCRDEPENQQSVVNYRLNNIVTPFKINYQSRHHCPTVQNLLLTVKSHQVEAAINGIKNTLIPSSRIFLLQNGMGTIEKVCQLLDGIVAPDQIYPGSNTHGVYLQKDTTEPLQVVHAGFGHLIFGGNYLLQQAIRQPYCLGELQKIALNTSWNTNIKHKLWLKLAVNAAINPLTAINNCLNGTLLDSSSLHEQLLLLCTETAMLFKAMAIDIHEDEIVIEVLDVIANTANNQSSMLQDIKSNKNTEIDAITGYLLEKSKNLKIPMPAHEALYKLLVAVGKNITR